MRRGEACRYFGLTDDDEGWDALNEIALEYKLDVELGPNGDVLRVNANDPEAKEALFGRHEKLAGHRPDDPKKVAEARRGIVDAEVANARRRAMTRERALGQRVQARKNAPRRIEGG